MKECLLGRVGAYVKFKFIALHARAHQIKGSDGQGRIMSFRQDMI